MFNLLFLNIKYRLNFFQAVVEQVSYTPFAMVSFYFGMSLLEGKSIEMAKQEVYNKFLPTYQVLMVFLLLLILIFVNYFSFITFLLKIQHSIKLNGLQAFLKGYPVSWYSLSCAYLVTNKKDKFRVLYFYII